jgi:putative FmdB family regulatory protein
VLTLGGPEINAMPTYEYACKECGEHLEVVQSFRDEPLTECPNCGGSLRKVFAPVGIVLKGSGFYRNDSRAPAKSEAKSDSKGDSSKSEPSKSESSKSDSKSESSKGDSSKSDSKGSTKAASA